MSLPSGTPSGSVRGFFSPAKVFAAALLAFAGVVAPSPSAAQKFSVVMLPDPQYYTEHPQYDLYSAQARWIRDNKTARNIKHVVVLGDLTNDNLSSQWTTADAAYTILDNASVPYAVVPGNHDYRTGNTDGWVGAASRNLTNYNNVLGPQRFAGKTWYGGNKDGGNENNYTYFSAGGVNFLVVGLEYSPRKETLTWANNLISQHPNHRVIIFTHAYTGVDGAYTRGGGSSVGMVGADGVDIFEECASRHSNVFMVTCGHVAESKLNTKVGNCGNTVYEMLVDYQGEKVKGTGVNLGNGWLRLLEFDPATNTVAASTVTVVPGNTTIFLNGVTQLYHDNYSASPTHVDHQFTIPFNFAPPAEPYTYLNDAVEFHDMAVNDIGGGDQLDPDIAQANNGNWAAVWEDDDDNNGVFRIFVRGFDSDGNERFADTVVNTSGVNTTNATNPSIAMAGDGRYVVVWQSSTTAIRMRTYNANGTPASAEQTVASTASPGVLKNPDVAMDDAGNFVVTWSADGDGNGSYQIKAQGFTFSSTVRFAAKTVNSVATGQQQNSVAAMAGNGDYVIAWEDDQNNDGVWEVCARGFLANETQRFAQLTVNNPTTGQQRDPDIAMDDSGRFVVVWEDDTDLNSSYQVKTRAFNANGTEMFSQRTVNQVDAGNQVNAAVSMDSFGNSYIVWQDDGAVSGGQGYQMMANEFTPTGARVFAADVQANSVSHVEHHSGNPSRNNPVVSAHKSGRYIVAWADDMDGNGSFQILARGVPGTARSLAVKAINGSVTRSPDEPFYNPNAVVTLTATPAAGYTFTGWQGDVPAGSELVNPLTITMSGDKHLVAKFGASVPPTAPTGLTATPVSATQINLAWTDTSANETNFVVARGTASAGPFTDIATLGANATSYSNTGLSPSTTYYYVVRATNAIGASANSNTAGATTPSAVPAAPSALTATSVSPTQINLTWTDNANNESNLVVARATAAGGPYTTVATLAANATSYSNTALAGNTRYYYAVRATNSFGASANSNEANALTWPADIIIDNSNTGFTASANWTTNTSAADKYGTNYRYRATAAVSDPARWTFSVPQTRSYDISAWWSAATNRSTAAPYILPDGTTVNKNQQANGGKWNLLATKTLTAGNQVVQLSCWAPSGFTVIADAVKLTAK